MTTDRKIALWSTDAAPALGLSTYGQTPAAVWAAKRGLVDPPDLSTIERVRLGLYFQPVIMRIHADETGDSLKSLDELEMMASPRGYPMGSHFDAWNDTTKRLHEIKNFDRQRRREFGDAGSGDVPMDVLIQCLHEMAVYNADRPPYGPAAACEVNVLFGGNERIVFVVPFDLEALEVLYAREGEFWAKVQSGEPPAATTPEDARMLFARDDGTSKTATAEVLRACNALSSIKGQIASLEGQEDALKAFVQTYMTEASTLLDGAGARLATWKADRDSERVDSKRLREMYPQIAAEVSKTVAGARKFLLKG